MRHNILRPQSAVRSFIASYQNFRHIHRPNTHIRNIASEKHRRNTSLRKNLFFRRNMSQLIHAKRKSVYSRNIKMQNKRMKNNRAQHKNTRRRSVFQKEYETENEKR